MKVWAVTWSGEDGAEVHLFAGKADAERKYDDLCRESDVDPDLGYAADGFSYSQRQADADDPDDTFAASARTGEHQVNITRPEPVEVEGSHDDLLDEVARALAAAARGDWAAPVMVPTAEGATVAFEAYGERFVADVRRAADG